MNYPIVPRKEQDKTYRSPAKLVVDILNWVAQNPEKAIVGGLILAFTGIGIAVAGAALQERQRGVKQYGER